VSVVAFVRTSLHGWCSGGAVAVGAVGAGGAGGAGGVAGAGAGSQTWLGG
jgi:hypothetical protein